MINMQDKTMSPRPYHMGKRKAAADDTRARILEAARQLLANESETDLSMEAIARRADVSRLTIYYQFKSRPGLLEALYDHLAIRGNMRRMAEVFHEADPSVALEKLVLTFVGFWSSDPVVIRRLRGIATLDAEIDQGIRARDARRQHAAREIIRRTVSGAKKKLSTEKNPDRRRSQYAHQFRELRRTGQGGTYPGSHPCDSNSHGSRRDRLGRVSRRGLHLTGWCRSRNINRY
jgi:AcrR family transcriptional regulator